MRSLLFCLFFSLGSSVIAQNYYVAIIKGSVTYNGKALKVRDKIQPNGELRFSAAGDYIKVSGPGGIYTLTPEQQSSGGGEFFTALREELFPATRLRGSFSSAIGMGPFEPDYFSLASHLSYFDKTLIPLREALLGHEQQLAFVTQSTDGTIHSIAAPIKDGALVLDRRSFDGIDISAGTIVGDSSYQRHSTAVVVVNNPVAWSESLATANSINELNWDSYTIAKDYSGAGMFMIATSEEELSPAELAARQTLLAEQEAAGRAFPSVDYADAAATVLDYFSPLNLVDFRVFKRDLKRQIRAMRPSSYRELMHDFYFDEYLEEVYGTLIFTEEQTALINNYIERFKR
ncbi:MAG: hypothetical protein AAF433_18995 [Bacteroidota bacterium]